jgi:hypothetical protein
MTLPNDTDDEKRKQRLEFDKTMKLLFHLSKKPTIDLINGLFHTNFIYDDVIVEYGSTEFVALNETDLESLMADMHIKIREKDKNQGHHLEFQTLNDHTMVFRMYHYGLHIAMEEMDLDKEKLVANFPQQLVIFLQKDEKIGDSLSLTLRFPNNQEIEYEVPVMKYWEKTIEELCALKLYPLLPMQIVQYRQRIEDIINKAGNEDEKKQLVQNEFADMKKTITEIGKIMEGLYKKHEIYGIDLDKVLSSMYNLSKILYKNYKEYNDFSEEVNMILESLVDPAVRESCRQEGIKEGIKGGVLDLLADFGPVNDNLREAINQQSDEGILKKWLKLAARSNNIDNFAQQVYA